MKKPVWYSSRKGDPRQEFVSFSAGRDVVPQPEADAVLVPYDLWTNRAHARVLHRAGVYTKTECSRILKALRRIENEWEKGSWTLDPQLEDVHINIESRVTQLCGEKTGGRLHSGRSRNDQVATDMKLYARDVVLRFIEETLALLFSLMNHARQHVETVMPGYTHHRKAMITTWGHWCAACAQGLSRDAQRFVDVYKRINSCPLGAAASYGTPWSLDRELASNLLAFDAVQENSLDAVSSRGEAESEIVQGACLLLKRLAGLSQDLILFSTEEFGFLSLPPDFTTGSSIMPQKRNPDFAEAIKGKSQVILGFAQALLSVDHSNLSGYNKDMQWSKYLFMDAVQEANGAGQILAQVMASLQVNEQKMRDACRSGFLNAVDVADYLAQSRGLPFRMTYSLLSTIVGMSTEDQFHLPVVNQVLNENQITPLTQVEFKRLHDPLRCLRTRDHVGSPHPTHVKRHLNAMLRQANALQKWYEKESQRIAKAQQRCKRINP